MKPEQLTPQMRAELDFWRGLVAHYGGHYYAYRASEYYEKVRYFPSFPNEHASYRGADVGCGCGSVFDLHKGIVDKFDVLSEQYMGLLSDLNQYEHYIVMPISFLSKMPAFYDWVACLNMIDHTPYPDEVVAVMHSALTPGGRLYFEVNLEAGLAAPHHFVCNENYVDRLLNPSTGFQQKHLFIQNVPEHNQRRYWAEYVKV